MTQRVPTGARMGARGKKPPAWLLPAAAFALLGAIIWRAERPHSLEGDAAPGFSLPVIHEPDGTDPSDRIRLEDLRGQVVLLDFWASWCKPCRAAVPGLSRIAEKYHKRGFQIIGINSEPLEADQVRRIANSWHFGYPIVIDGTTGTTGAYGVQAYPTLALIDRAGVVRRVFAGDPGERALAREIEKLLE
jgi:thiol-disulfide isomerase/thioredoxin